jgi:hypothetical protein
MYSRRNRQLSHGSLDQMFRVHLPSPLTPQNYLLLRYLLREDHKRIRENLDRRHHLLNLIRTLAHHPRSHRNLSSLLPALSAAQGYHQDMNQLRLSHHRHRCLGHCIHLMRKPSLSTRMLRDQAPNLLLSLNRKGYRNLSH